ncbi:unnamed protein product [Prorocentrum cordatum]|uniref:Autophagy-related protein 9 n=1 Tax=Prorocentrum cordatum TaxID=2364126 RepID=A0ABN9RUA9_9DINO|nr:unnamed protein product [Polarella glacialis]
MTTTASLSRSGRSRPRPRAPAYYMSPSRNVYDIWEDPLQAFCYVTFAHRDVGVVPARRRKQPMMFKRHRESSLVHMLRKYTLTAAAFGGMCISIITFSSLFATLRFDWALNVNFTVRPLGRLFNVGTSAEGDPRHS